MTAQSLSLRLAAVLLLAASAAQVQASAGYTIPDSITVDEPTALKIDVRVAPDSELRQRFHAYRVFLAVEPPGWGLGPICYLAYSVPLGVHNITVTVPADVVPDDTSIQISTGLIYNGNPTRVNGFNYSGYTRLLGGNGTWIQRELDGWVIGDQDSLSCEAFGCARQCHDRYYTGDESRISDGSGDGKADACTRDCANDLNPESQSGEGAVARASLTGALLMSTAAMMALFS